MEHNIRDGGFVKSTFDIPSTNFYDKVMHGTEVINEIVRHTSSSRDKLKSKLFY